MKRIPKGLLLLLELVTAVAVFAVAAAVCGLLLTEAEQTSREAARLERAVAALTSAAEELRAAEDPAQVLEDLRQQPCLQIRGYPGDGLIRYELEWLEDGRSVWRLDVVREVAP